MRPASSEAAHLHAWDFLPKRSRPFASTANTHAYRQSARPNRLQQMHICRAAETEKKADSYRTIVQGRNVKLTDALKSFAVRHGDECQRASVHTPHTHSKLPLSITVII